ncbi:MAG: protein translocase subunit SecF [Deltaproteobacteria bacterium]|nr:protein translocase subunit SecF [Deltaproteobacteria bacterium]
MFELVPSGTTIDFIGKRRLCAALSIGLLLVSVAAGLVRGVNFGIDFEGGTEVQLRFSEAAPADEGAIRRVVSDCGIEDATVVTFGSPREFLVKFGQPSEELVTRLLRSEQCPITASEREAVERLREDTDASDVTGQVVAALGHAISNGVSPVEIDRVEFVGPRVGAELRRDGLNALGIATLLILVYVAFRFTTRFAPGAILAVVHDIGITAGIFVIFGLEFDLKVLAALLAIIGYSLNDTIIIYDRIRENMELRTKHDLVDVLNRSVNQTLSRTVLTSGTTMAAVLSLLFLGGEVVRPFALAMTVGIVVGTYSSIFIAAPTLLWLEQRYAKKSA